MRIILIGMPGCGKTTVGRALAKRLGFSYACTDEAVEARTGMSIPEIFDVHGEPTFRAEERAAVAALTERTDIVIATGGGAVLDAENRERIKAAGQAGGAVIWLERELSELARDGRPLSRDMTALREMYEIRRLLYAALADMTVPVRAGVDDVVGEIVARLAANGG